MSPMGQLRGGLTSDQWHSNMEGTVDLNQE